jgi:putative membrane protein
MSVDLLSYLLIAILGAVIASLLALIPALHIYNVITLAFLFAGGLQAWLHPDQFAMLLLGMVTGYAVLSVIPSIYLAAPDETSAFIVLPGQKWLLERRGYEAAILTGAGSLCGVIVLVLLSPVLTEVARALRIVLAPHFGWILAAISLFMLMSEWPKAGDRGPSNWARFRAAWSQLGAGLLTFFLSGLLGIILMYRNFLPVNAAFANLLPAFIGLFAIPMVLTNLIMGTRVPPQHISTSIDLSPSLLLRGTFAGSLGGLFAAFFPVVTGGIGSFLAGHATAQRDERTFIVSQGVSKLVYYAGGFLLFFLPGLSLARGGMAAMLSTIYTPGTPQMYVVAVAALAVSGAVSFLLLIPYSRFAVRFLSRLDYRVVNIGTLIVILAVLLLTTGLTGLLIAIPATAIGLIPSLFGSRRMNCLGVLLVPIILNMAGAGPEIARWLGLG